MLPFKVAVFATWESKSGCTNWRGYEQAMYEKFGKENVKCFDFLLMSLEEMSKGVMEYKPDYLFILLQMGLDIDLKKIKEALPNCTIIFHYMDYNIGFQRMSNKHTESIDFMFLSNKDQIPLYKDHFRIKNIFYCPTACYRLDLSEEVQINAELTDKLVFVGSIVEHASEKHIHYERSMFWKEMKKAFNGRLVNINQPAFPARREIYNKLPVIYKSAQYSLNMDAVKPGMESYTSNRIWAIINLGGVPLTHKFNGIEEHGFVDGKNCIMFDLGDINSLKEKVDYYDERPNDLLHIRKEAMLLGRRFHTHINRIDTMLDAINEVKNGN